MTNNITVIGNLAADPEIRYTPQGKAVTEFTVADTPRRFDQQSNSWVDGEPNWWRVVVWDRYANNVAATLKKGDQVIVYGEQKTSRYKDNNNEDRTSAKLNAVHVAPTLQFATAELTRNPRGTGGGNGGNNGGNNAPATSYNAPSSVASEDTPF